MIQYKYLKSTVTRTLLWCMYLYWAYKEN